MKRATDDSFTELSGMPPVYFENMKSEFPDIDEGALRVFLALRAATRRVENVVAHWLDRSGMTVTKLDVLHVLAAAERGATISQLRDFLRMTQPNVTFVVQSLERDGYVRRKADRADRRRSVVRITAVGRRRIAELTPEHVESMRVATATIDDDERERLIDILARVTRGYETLADGLTPPD